MLAQEFRDFELCVVDDAPDFPSEDVVISCRDPRIRYIRHSKRRGAAAARNTGIREARGRYIAFLDDDDLWHPGFLARMVEAMDKLPQDVGVLHCGQRQIDGAGQTVQVLKPRHRGWIRQELLRGEKSSGIVGLIRRACFTIGGGFDEALPSAQDWELWIRISESFAFDYIEDVLVDVRVFGDRISAVSAHAITAREHIVRKHYAAMAKVPGALAIHMKRLGKLNALQGRWGEAFRWFRGAASLGRGEALKIAGWVLMEYPWLCARRFGAGVPVAALAVVVAFLSQQHALTNPYMVNDDVCQHIWWMRIFSDGSLFPHDLLLQYAASLQNFGILALYWLTSPVMDPLVLTRILPFVLFPTASWALYRLVLSLTSDTFTAVLAALMFMMTPLYIQHMTGGHAHVFGYPLGILFLYFLSCHRWRAAGAVVLAGAFFFPVMLALGSLAWLIFLCMPDRNISSRRESLQCLAVVLVAGLSVLFMKFGLLHDPQLGHALAKADIQRMPELTSVGRWDVWPVLPVQEALVRTGEAGVFVFKAVQKSFLPDTWKEVLINRHILWVVLAVLSSAWWWSRRRETSVRQSLRLGISFVGAGVLLYLLAAAVLLKLYAPDRYLFYSATLVTLVFLAIPLGMTVSALRRPWLRRVLQAGLLMAVFVSVPLVRNAGLYDYAANRGLYQFLASLPKNALIAARPDLADAIPLFSRRSVWVNAELSVPLLDRYWDTVKMRTYDWLNAYYADDPREVARFIRRSGVTHLVVDRRDFPLKPEIYTEPFRGFAEKLSGAHSRFVLGELPTSACIYIEKDICVVPAAALAAASAGKGQP